MNHPAAFITGSSRGIGRAIAEALAEEGFAIALNAPEADADLARAEAAIAAKGVPVTTAVLDVSDLGAHDITLAQIEDTIGPLTTLVNNAGVGVMQRGDILDVSEESFDRCMAVNAKAQFFLSQAFARRLLARERDSAQARCIVNITSANAGAVAAPRAEYCASKAAAAMTSAAFAVRLGPENIAVYDVRPGLIETEMTAPVIDHYHQRAAEGLTLIPRVGQPEEVGRIVATLATGKLPYTTGQVIHADAGMLMPRF